MFNFFKRKSNSSTPSTSKLENSISCQSIFQEWILPEIQPLGFQLIKSELVRQVGDFKQIISLQKSRTNNQTSISKFKVRFIVEYIPYKKWYKVKYNEKLPNDYRVNDQVLWAIHDQVPNWYPVINLPQWYDLRNHDNAMLVEELKSKIVHVAIPYMDEFSDLEKVIVNNCKDQKYTKIPMILDFCEILHDIEKAQEIRTWFRTLPPESKLKFEKDLLFEIEKRM